MKVILKIISSGLDENFTSPGPDEVDMQKREISSE